MKSLLFSLFLMGLITSDISSQITDYQVFFGTAKQAGQQEPLVVLRQWRQAGAKKLLVVHPGDLSTKVVSASSLQVQPASWQAVAQTVKETAYIKSMSEAFGKDQQLRDASTVATNRYKKGIDLTIDLCSSSGVLDRKFIDDVVKLMNPDEKPVRLTVAVTGMWMIQHPSDLQWLKQQEKSGILKITWVNHSFHHQHTPGKVMPLNFLLNAGADIDNQILQTEKLMLANSITPSVYFRFPGDVSDEMVYNKAAEYGLIGLGSDAWLARGQYPNNSKSIFVQPNGDDPFKKSVFMETLRNNRTAILNRRWMMVDLMGF